MFSNIPGNVTNKGCEHGTPSLDEQALQSACYRAWAKDFGEMVKKWGKKEGKKSKKQAKRDGKCQIIAM